MLLEVHQPERQLQRVDAKADAVLPEGGGIFAVRVDKHHVAVRSRFENLVQECRDGCGLADAGRAQHREVLAKQCVQIERRLDVGRGMDVAERDGGGVLEVENLGPVGLRGRVDPVAGERILRDATAKIQHLARLRKRTLADQAHLRVEMLVTAARREHAFDRGKDDVAAHRDLDHRPDADAGSHIGACHARRIEAHRRHRTRHRNDFSKQEFSRHRYLPLPSLRCTVKIPNTTPCQSGSQA